MNLNTTVAVPESLRCETLSVEPARFDEASGTLTLGFRFDDEPAVEEAIVFAGGPFTLSEAQRAAFDRLAGMLGVIAATSYFKARLPETVRVSSALGEAGRELVCAVFGEGLAEFAYRNGLDAPEPGFSFGSALEGQALAMPEGEGWLVAVGGGKDSVVAMEMLRQAGWSATAACVGAFEPVRECAAIAGLELLEIERRLGGELARWNASGAPNGHVPVTAIHSLILLMQAVLSGRRGVVMANERSADEPTVADEAGAGVNHQYSKSWAFEHGLRAWMAEDIGPGLGYFSILRPLSELEICRRFAALPEYHGAFVSCNAAYRRDPDERVSRWCGDCAKCRFVFLGLAPFMRPSDLVEVFGADLLGDASQSVGFSALLSKDAKPFECVGTRAEVRAAFGLLLSDPNWRDAPVVQAVTAEYGITPFRLEHAKGVLSPSGEHAIPVELASKLGL
jgi:hypothetical protein